MKKWVHRLCALMLGLIVCTQYAVADDIEIYTNPANNSFKPPYTVLVLDLNLLGLCPASTASTNPSTQLCLNLATGATLGSLLTSLGQDGSVLLKNLLLGSYQCGTRTSNEQCRINAAILCDVYDALGLSGPNPIPIPGLSSVLGPILNGVTTLSCQTVGFLLDIVNNIPILGPLLGSLLNGIMASFVGPLIDGLVNPLLSTVLGALPATIVNLIQTTLTGLVSTFLSNIGIPSLISLLESILKTLVNTNVAIMVSHADRSSLAGTPLGNTKSLPASNCAFADAADIRGARRTTTGCSNGAYVLVGFTKLVDQGSVQSLLTTVTNLLLGILNPATLLQNIGSVLGTAVTTPTQLLPPYQAKEVYAELSHYLAGDQVYNAPLKTYDGIVGLLSPAQNQMNAAGQTIAMQASNGNYIPPALECDTANVLNVMLTANTRDRESNQTLKDYFPALPTDPDPFSKNPQSVDPINLADVVAQAKNPGIPVFTNSAGVVQTGQRKIALNSYFLVQSLLTNTATLSNAGATLLTYIDSLGLLGLGQTSAELLKPVLRVDASLNTPSLTADLTQPSIVRPEAFFTLFKPAVDKTPRWDGNLKKLNVKADSNNQYQYYDARNALAVDTGDGRIKSSAVTYWTNTGLLGTATADGRTTALGGAGQKIPGFALAGGGNPGRVNGDNQRQLFFDRLGTSGQLSLAALDADSQTVRDELKADLGVTGTATADDTLRRSLLLYARGFDVGTAAAPKGSGTSVTGVAGRAWMHGALLHSRPVAINYGARSGYTAASPDIRIVYGAADGYLRMVRNSDGVENWGFMPRVVMNQQQVLRENVATAQFPYGVDGAPAVLVQDRSSSGGAADGRIESSNSNDRAWMFFGLRRSGRYVYGMNVTNPDSPSLLWRIGPDGLYRSTGLVSGTASNYSELGLTFSSPQIGRMNVTDGSSTSTKPVLIFAGGYNGGRDSSNNKIGKDYARGSDGRVGTDDSVGNALYIVDAETGDLIWKAKQGAFSSSTPYNSSTKTFQHPLLVNSIPADVTIVDTNGDGITDRLYVADTGGRLWRADFPGSDRSKWVLTPLASVGRHNASTSTVANDRRFFHAPDYAPYRTAIVGSFDVVLFGSGDREDPLNVTTENYLYAYRDFRTASSLTKDDVITTEAGLKGQSAFADLTTACATASDSCSNSSDLSTGWRLRLSASGEKLLSQPLSTDGTSFFSTYVPPDTTTQSCEPSEGSSRLYGVALSDSRPRYNQFMTDSYGDLRQGAGVSPGLPGEFSPLTASALTANAQTLSTSNPPTYPYFWRERRGDEEKAIRQP